MLEKTVPITDLRRLCSVPVRPTAEARSARVPLRLKSRMDARSLRIQATAAGMREERSACVNAEDIQRWRCSWEDAMAVQQVRASKYS